MSSNPRFIFILVIRPSVVFYFETYLMSSVKHAVPQSQHVPKGQVKEKIIPLTNIFFSLSKLDLRSD